MWARVLLLLLLASSARAAVVVNPQSSPYDARSTIQSAVDGCQCRVQLTNGRYKLSGPILIPDRAGVMGEGVGTIIEPTGDFYAFLFVGGQGASVSKLRIESSRPMYAGGGVSFAGASVNVVVEDLFLGNNLAIGLDIAPNRNGQGIYTISQIRFHDIEHGTAVTNVPIGIRVGDGVHHVSDVTLQHISATGATQGASVVWMLVSNDTDTISLSYSTFYRGTYGILMANGEGALATGVSLTDVVVEEMAQHGIWAGKVQNLRISHSSFSGNARALWLSSGVKVATVFGSTFQTQLYDTIGIAAGSTHTSLTNNKITDNNTSRSPYGFAVSVGAGASDFSVSGNQVSNNAVWGGGGQTACVFVAPGPSDRYVVKDNVCVGTGGILDYGTGTRKRVESNVEAP